MEEQTLVIGTGSEKKIKATNKSSKGRNGNFPSQRGRSCRKIHEVLATTAANSAELSQLRAATAECRPDPGKPSQAPSFVPTEETKLVAVAVDDADPTKTVRVGSQLLAK